jgi:dihydrofolate reductase
MSQPPAPAIYLVAAVAANGIIGANGGLPWHLPGELAHFKKLTLGHPIIMGRRTWESLGERPLPGRENIVVTGRADYRAEGAAIARSLDAAVALCMGEPLAFVIGGTRLFEEALPIARVMVLTEIQRDYEGDARFPPYDRSQWRETQREAHAAPDGTRFDYVLYERV